MSQITKPKPDREAPPGTAGKRPDPNARGESKPAKDRSEADRRLDEGLEETFPSSDPVSVRITK